MKSNFLSFPFTKSMYCLMLILGILLNDTARAVNDTEDGNKTERKKKKTEKRAARHSLNNSSVKIYPDAVKKEMHVVSKDKIEMNFFVFDLEGTLVLSQKMQEGDHFRITGLAKGTYTYHAFSGDEEKATGKFEIR